MNKEFTKDFSKAVLKEDINSSELPSGSKRRYDPTGGVRKHNERIHRESKFIDNHKNLPFSFSKPTKLKKQIIVECCNCGYTSYVNRDTVGIICSECKKYSAVKEATITKYSVEVTK